MIGRLLGSPILRIELWHGFLLAALIAVLVPLRALDAWAFLLGGLFMGVNFLLLGYGVQRLLSAFAVKGRVRAGIVLLVLKFVLFLGLLSGLIFRVQLDARSFAIGVSSLLAAIILERLWASQCGGA